MSPCPIRMFLEPSVIAMSGSAPNIHESGPIWREYPERSTPLTYTRTCLLCDLVTFSPSLYAASSLAALPRQWADLLASRQHTQQPCQCSGHGLRLYAPTRL